MLLKLILAFVLLLISACSEASSPLAGPSDQEPAEVKEKTLREAAPADDALLYTMDADAPAPAEAVPDTVFVDVVPDTVFVDVVPDTVVVVDTVVVLDVDTVTIYLTHEGYEATAAHCADGIDNDGDGLIDCLDRGCEMFLFCVNPEDIK